MRDCIRRSIDAMRKPLIRRLFGPIVLLVLLTVIQGSYYLSAFGPLTVPDAGMHIGGGEHHPIA